MAKTKHLVMGKDVLSMTQEEKNQMMAEWRSRRKNGNGRLGLKNKDAQFFHTDNFETGQKRKIGQRQKHANEHIKCIFVCARDLYPSKYAYAQRPIYLFGFLTDSNRYAFEDFKDTKGPQVTDTVDEGSYRLEKFARLFRKKNIDKKTYIIIDIDGISEKQFVYNQIILMASFTEARVKLVKNSDIIKTLCREYNIYKYVKYYENCDNYHRSTINKMFTDIYKFVVENKLCPWITEENWKFIDSLVKYKKRSYKILHLGLFFSLLRKFNIMIHQGKRNFQI